MSFAIDIYVLRYSRRRSVCYARGQMVEHFEVCAWKDRSFCLRFFQVQTTVQRLQGGLERTQFSPYFVQRHGACVEFVVRAKALEPNIFVRVLGCSQCLRLVYIYSRPVSCWDTTHLFWSCSTLVLRRRISPLGSDLQGDVWWLAHGKPSQFARSGHGIRTLIEFIYTAKSGG